MRNMYVISGVAGMTGNELAHLLLLKKQLVIGFDNYFCSSSRTIEDLFSDANFAFMEWDLNNTDQMNMLKESILSRKDECDSIIYVNCAAVVHTKYFYDVEATFSTNVLGMRAFLRQAIDVGADIYINCSTSEVYSMQSWKTGGVKEDDYLMLANAEHSQRTSYAAGKLMTEFFMKDAVDKGLIKGCSIRFANVYSKNELYPEHIIPHIISQLRESGEVVLLENSKVNRRTFLHNEDSCAAVLALIESENALDGSVYNVATDEEISIIELVHLCAKVIGVESPIIKYEGYRASDPERRVLNTEKIRSRTNWEPKINLQKGIKMCVEDKLS